MNVLKSGVLTMRISFKSKTTWAGVGLIGYGVSRIISGDYGGLEDVFNGLAFIFLRSAINNASSEYNNFKN